MVSTRSKGRGKTNKKHQQIEEGNGKRAGYEESRVQRIKENVERMKSLGIFDLSKTLKHPSSKPSSSLRKNKPTSSAAPSNRFLRRSSRLKDKPLVSYSDKRTSKALDKSVKNMEIHIPEGEKPEIYTEEHEKLLGDAKAVWTLYVDGYDEDGQRIYDPVEGKTCHQCRQKTLGHHTACSKCDMVTGQFCGDCLYMRYGENVREVNQNSDWICPVCRGVCNCSRCRRDRGWAPTGAIYRKVVSLGFKSVAHYLIYTHRGQEINEVAAADGPISADGLFSIDDGKQESSDALSLPAVGGEKNQIEEDDMKQDSDEEYKGDDFEEDNSNVDGENSSQ